MSGAIAFPQSDMKTEIGRATLKNCGFLEVYTGALGGE
jgi:hypothetical protein